MKEFYSNGKLLITGEYAVLDGATAFALPTKFGQSLTVTETSDHLIHWKSFDSDGSLWFECVLPLDEIKNISTSENDTVKKTLVKILYEASLLKPDFLKKSKGFSVETKLTFPRFWGLGTSSTLINNIAQWFGVNAFESLQNSFGGSGYDIANAQNNSPILYQRDSINPIITAINFNPEFTSNIYFVYLNKKQDSKSAIAAYYEKRNDNSEILLKITELTLAAVKAQSVNEFCNIIDEHESLLSSVLGMKTVKENLFPDFRGSVKSLGGWGGDFIMAVSNEDPTAYFFDKGFSTVIPYREMIL